MMGEVVELRPRRRVPHVAASPSTEELRLAAELTRRRRAFWATSIVVLSAVATLVLVQPRLLATDLRMAYLFLWSCSMLGFIGSAIAHERAEHRLRARHHLAP